MLAHLKMLFRQAFSDWNEHDAPTMGAALAYYSVLSLAPGNSNIISMSDR